MSLPYYSVIQETKVKANCMRKIKATFNVCLVFHTGNFSNGYPNTSGYINHERYAKRLENDDLITNIQKALAKI